MCIHICVYMHIYIYIYIYTRRASSGARVCWAKTHQAFSTKHYSTVALEWPLDATGSQWLTMVCAEGRASCTLHTRERDEACE